MSTLTTAASHPQRAPARSFSAHADLLLPAFSLWLREIIRFYRMRSRVVGVIISPVLFWLVLGSGFGSSLRRPAGGEQHYLEYFFPGALIMIVLFTSIFAMMSLIEDRREGFLLSVLVSPASRSAIVLGKVLGGATLAFLQGLIFLVFAPLIGVRMGLAQIGISVLAIFLIAFALTALGFTIAWRLDSTQAFHAIINLFLIPLWLLCALPCSKAVKPPAPVFPYRSRWESWRRFQFLCSPRLCSWPAEGEPCLHSTLVSVSLKIIIHRDASSSIGVPPAVVWASRPHAQI